MQKKHKELFLPNFYARARNEGNASCEIGSLIALLERERGTIFTELRAPGQQQLRQQIGCGEEGKKSAPDHKSGESYKTWPCRDSRHAQIEAGLLPHSPCLVVVS